MKENKMKRLALFVLIFSALVFVINVGPKITGFAMIDYKSVDSIISIDVPELKYDLVAGETKKVVFYVKNHLTDMPVNAEVGASGKASNFIAIDERRFTVPPGGIEDVELKIYVPLEAVPQLYFGEVAVTAEGKGKIVPIQLSIKKRIQDSLTFKLTPQKFTVRQGEELGITVDIENSARENADVQLNLKMHRGDNVVYESTESLSLENRQTKDFISFIPKGAEPGVYTIELRAAARMGLQYNVFESRRQITVEQLPVIETPAKTRNTLLWWVLIGVIGAIVLITSGAVISRQVLKMPKVVKILDIKPQKDEDTRQFVKEGFSYVIDEKGMRTSYETIRMLHTEGFKVLCITRLNPKLLTDEVPEFKLARIHWLTTQEGDNTLGPTDIEGIYNAIDKFIVENERSAIILDGLSFLAVNTSFDQVMLLLQYIKDRVSTAKSIFIAPLNTKSLSRKEMESISGEMTLLDGNKEILLEIYRSEEEVDEFEKRRDVHVTQQLLDYIKKEIDLGYEEMKIISVLVSHGWSRYTIKTAVDMIKHPELYADEIERVTGKRPGKVDEAMQAEAEEKPEELTRDGKGEPKDEEPVMSLGKAGPAAEKSERVMERKDEKALKKEQLKPAAKQPPVRRFEPKPESKNLAHVEKEFQELKKMLEDAISSGKSMTKFSIHMKLAESDLAIAKITNDDKDLERVKSKLEEIRNGIKSDATESEGNKNEV